MFGRPHFPYSLQTRRSRRHHGKPEYHRNIPSAFFGLVVAGLFAVTIAEPNWFHLDGGLCTGRHVGLYTIFGADDQHLKGSCITDDVVMKLRICATLCLLGIVSSMFQFSLDVCGANKRGLKWLRRNSIGNIFAVLLAIAIMGICYWITVDINRIKLSGTINVVCSYEVAFYLVIGAGVAGIIATALNLLHITCEKNERRRRYESDMQLQLILNSDLNNALPDDSASLPPLPPPVYQP